MSEVNKFIDDILERHNYRVILKYDKELVVTYPNNTIDIYEIDDNGIMYIGDNQAPAEFIPCRPHVSRLYILLDVMKNMKKQSLSPNLIRYYCGEEVANSIDGIIPLNEEYAEWEGKLYNVCKDILKDKSLLHAFDEDLKKLGLYGSFMLLKSLLV